MSTKSSSVFQPQKHRRPLIHNVIIRKRLFHTLDEAESFPLTAAIAPPGYGKTTLISSYVASKKATQLWYAIDESDSDLASFFDKFAYAVQQATPKRRKTIPRFQKEDFLNLATFARRFFNVVYQRLERDFYLIFDDIQECQSNHWFSVLAIAANELPMGARIFVLSRQALPKELSRLQINQSVSLLDENELRFSDEELFQLAQKHQHQDLSAQQCKELQSIMDGWGAGLTLVLSRKKENQNSDFQNIRNHQELFNYFMNEVIKHTDQETRQMLYSTCFLSVINSHHAKILSNIGHCDKLLEEMHNQGYFTYRVEGSAEDFKYHPLFKSLLIKQSKDFLGEQEWQRVVDNSINILENENQTEDAIGLIIAFCSKEKLAEFTIKFANSLYIENRIHTLIKCLKCLPEEFVSTSSWLLFWRGTCFAHIQPDVARKDFEQAYTLFTNDANASGRCMALTGIIDSYMFERNDFSQLDPWINLINAIEPELIENASPNAWSSLVVNMFSAMTHRTPEHPRFNTWLERAEQTQNAQLPPNLQLTRQLTIVLHYLWQGDFNKAAIHHDVLEKHFREGYSAIATTMWHVIHCCYLWMATPNTAQSIKIAKQGLETAKDFKLPKWDISFLTHGAAAALTDRNVKEAKKFLDLISVYENEARQTHLAMFYKLNSIFHFRYGDKNIAEHYAKYFHQAAQASGIPFYECSAHFTLAELYLKQGELEKFQLHLQQMKSISYKTKSFYQQFHALLLEAVYFSRLNKTDLALTNLKKALSLAEDYNLLPALWICEEELIQALVLALNNNIKKNIVRRIIQERRFSPGEIHQNVPYWPWPIRIHTLGELNVSLNDKVQKLSERNKPKVFALLKILIAHGANKVKEELICESIWPDAEGDIAHQSFNTSLFRLRKILGRHDAIINQNGEVSLNPQICWLDIWVLQSDAEKLDKLLTLQNLDNKHLMKVYQNIIELYKADFLHNEDQYSQVVNYRNKLRTLLSKVLIRFSRHCHQENQLHLAEESLLNAMRIDSLAESTYHHLIKFYILTARYADAVYTYKQCEKQLETNLNVPPSKSTQQLLMQIPKVSLC